MLAYAEEHFRAPAADGKPAALVQTSLQSDTPRNQLLEQHGFERTDDFLAWHEFALDQPPPEPQLPPHFAFETMENRTDYEARVNAHRAAFHPSRLKLDMYMRARELPTYDPSLDLVAVAPNGEIAAYTILWFDAENRVALFEPVGCHPDYQRRGLGRAVLYEGLRRLYERGATRAHVAAWRDDSAGALLYRAAGFQLINRFYDWHKSYLADAENNAGSEAASEAEAP